MIYQYHLLKRAQDEYEDSIKWYAERSVNVAENFIDEIENTIDTICKNPFRYKNIYNHFRERQLKRFPFVIIYFIEKENHQLIITSIFHTSRNPKLKYRIKK